MKSLNDVKLIGYVGQDPEIRATGNGTAVANFSLSTSEVWTDRESNERKERTEWHRLVAFGRVAEIVRDYVSKGSPLYVGGSLRTRQWEDKDGNKRYTTEINVTDVSLLRSRADTEAGNGNGNGADAKTEPASDAAPNPFDEVPGEDEVPN